MDFPVPGRSIRRAVLGMTSIDFGATEIRSLMITTREI
jgi:hypothetical protein